MNTFYTCTDFNINVENLIGNKYNVSNKDSAIYKIAMFNCDKMGLDIDKYCVCASFLNVQDAKIISKSDDDSVSSSYTVLSNSRSIGCITMLSYNDYVFKKYRNTNYNDCLAFACIKGKHIIFNGNMCSFFTGEHALVMKIDICKSCKCMELNDCDSNCDVNIIEDKYIGVELDDKLNKDFYDSVFYKNDFTAVKFVFDIVDDDMLESSNFVFSKANDNSVSSSGDDNEKMFKQHILELDNVVKLNRFYQRYKKHILPENVCKWMINDTEKYAKQHGWRNDIYGGEVRTYDIELEKLSAVHEYFMNFELTGILDFIVASYNFPSYVQVNIKSLNITKYSNDLTTGVDWHADEELLSFVIGLNDNYVGGGTKFSDGVVESLKTGEMLVHCGKYQHTGVPIVEGCRYILVGFIQVDV